VIIQVSALKKASLFFFACPKKNQKKFPTKPTSKFLLTIEKDFNWMKILQFALALDGQPHQCFEPTFHIMTELSLFWFRNQIWIFD